MKCIKTGADVFLPESGETFHGDLWANESCAILNIAGCSEPQYDNVPVNLIMHTAHKIGSSAIYCGPGHMSEFYYHAIHKDGFL